MRWLLPGIAACLAAIAPLADAAAQGRPRPAAPPGWFFDPAADENGFATLTYDDCRLCWNESYAPIRASCSRSEQGLSIALPGQGPRAQALRGRRVALTLEIDGVPYTLQAAAVENDLSSVMEVAIPLSLAHGGRFYDHLALGNALTIIAPSGRQSYALRGSGAAVTRWRAACEALASGARAPATDAAASIAGSGSGTATGAPANAGLDRHVGGYDYEQVLREPAVAAALDGMLTPQQRRLLRENLGVVAPIVLQGGRLVLAGLAPHGGGINEAMVTIDAATAAVEIGLMVDSRVTIVSRTARQGLSEPIIEWAATRQSNPPGFQFRQAGRAGP